MLYIYTFPIASCCFFVQWVDLGFKNPLQLAHSGYQDTKIFGTKVWGGSFDFNVYGLIVNENNEVNWNPRNHPQLLSQKSWHLGIRNGPIARGFWNLNQSIEQKVKNLLLEKCRYIKDIQITFWDTAQYFHSKQLIKSFEKIFSLIFSRLEINGKKVVFKQILWPALSCQLH